MGVSSRYSQQMEGETVDGTAQGASRDLQDEGHCSQLHVVAWHGCLHREASQELCGLSSCQELTTSGTVITLGMAIPSVPEGSR